MRQLDCDVDEILWALRTSVKLGNLTFKAIVAARKLTVAEAAMLAEKVLTARGNLNRADRS